MKFSSVSLILIFLAVLSVSSVCLAEDTGTTTAGDNRKLKITEQPLPKAPAGDVCVQGTVYLQVAFLANGEIGDVFPLTPAAYLTDLAVDAALRIKFETELMDGNPAAVTRVLRYSFSWETGWQAPDVTAPRAENCAVKL